MEEHFLLHGYGVEVGNAISMVQPILFSIFREYYIESPPEDSLKPVDDNHVILNVYASKHTYL